MDHIIWLLSDFKEFSESARSDSFSLFGEWLKQKYGPENEYITDEEAVNRAGLDVMASYLIGGLASYAEVWVKVTYEGLPLLSLGDFAILKTIQQLGNPSKTQVAEEVTMERTTCIESIKRLARNGILQEETDPSDRRLKRVRLTPDGQALLRVVDAKMVSLGKLLVGNLSHMEKKSLIPLLNKLKCFHEDLYKNRAQIDIKTLYNL